MSSEIILCRCCGQPTATAEQKHWDGSGSFTLLTCWNKDCDLRGYTFGEPDYHTMDLSAYHRRDEAWTYQ